MKWIYVLNLPLVKELPSNSKGSSWLSKIKVSLLWVYNSTIFQTYNGLPKNVLSKFLHVHYESIIDYILKDVALLEFSKLDFNYETNMS